MEGEIMGLEVKKTCKTQAPNGMLQYCCFHDTRLNEWGRCCQCREFNDSPTQTLECTVCHRVGDGHFVDYPIDRNSENTEMAFTCYQCMEAVLTFLGVNLSGE